MADLRPEDPMPRGEEKVKAVRLMFDSIAPRYDLVNGVMTFGMDTGWRRRTIEALMLAPGSTVLDVACGTGDLCREIRKARYRAIGFDMSAGMLAQTRTKAPLVLADALRLPVGDASADGVTCGFALRNVADLGSLFAEFARVLRPGGRVALLEVAEPRSALPKLGHRFYFRRIVPLIGGLLSNGAAYRYLPRSTTYLPPLAEMLEMLSSAGFQAINRRPLGLGAAQLISATRL
ncbi:MAG: ubiquinone/menaquinone biosynthesis methyltransferase [Actinomycetota bacterium]